MARSLSIAAYLAGLRRHGPQSRLAAQPQRPAGAVVWARCTDAGQLTGIASLQRKLAEDGDAIQIIATLRDPSADLSGTALPEPVGKAAIRAFLAHWQPMLAIWAGDVLDPVLLVALRARGVPCVLVDASGHGVDQMPARWVPGTKRALWREFAAVLAVDNPAAARLIRAGASPTQISITGPMQDGGTVLPCDEGARRALAAALGTRQVWLAAGARLDDTAALCAAQRQASKRTHRLLLIVLPDHPRDAPLLAAQMRAAGLDVALRSQTPAPSDPVQVYIIDTAEPLGLWYLIAPITYLGGSLHGGGCRDPFEAANLGSAIVHGPHVAPHDRHAARLARAGATRPISTPDALGNAIEELLAADKTAQLAHAAWDVTSQGADVTNRLAALIHHQLDTMVA